MKDKDLLVDRVSKKTNVKKEDIFKLANDLQRNTEKYCFSFRRIHVSRGGNYMMLKK